VIIDVEVYIDKCFVGFLGQPNATSMLTNLKLNARTTWLHLGLVLEGTNSVNIDNETETKYMQYKTHKPSQKRQHQPRADILDISDVSGGIPGSMSSKHQKIGLSYKKKRGGMSDIPPSLATVTVSSDRSIRLVR
jgi:hypothetical protein